MIAESLSLGPLPPQQMWQNAWLSSLDFVQAHLDVICMSVKAIGYVFFYLFKLKKFFYNVVLVSAIQQSQKEKNKQSVFKATGS